MKGEDGVGFSEFVNFVENVTNGGGRYGFSLQNFCGVLLFE